MGGLGVVPLSLFREFSANLSTRHGVIILLVDAVEADFVSCVYNGFMALLMAGQRTYVLACTLLGIGMSSFQASCSTATVLNVVPV